MRSEKRLHPEVFGARGNSMFTATLHRNRSWLAPLILSERIPMRDAYSPFEQHPYSSSRRIDPYFDGVWGAGALAQWFSSQQARDRRGTGLSQLVPPHMLMTELQAEKRLLDPEGWSKRLSLLGAIDGWRTMTIPQARAFGASHHIGVEDPDSDDLPALFSAGIIDIGMFRTTAGDMVAGKEMLIRPAPSTEWVRLFRRRMTFPERVFTTGGLGWSSSGQHDRHNLLSVELGLRAAEYLPVGTVLAEKYAAAWMLGQDPLNPVPYSPTAVKRKGDGVIVRSDGLRIVVEVQAAAGEALEMKAMHWARVLQANPLRKSGLVVVFVAAPNKQYLSPRGSLGYDPRTAIYQVVNRVRQQFPGTGEGSVASRMAVVTWTDWFPARHHLSEAFMTLRVHRPIRGGVNPWVETDLLDEEQMPFAPESPEAMRAVIANSALLASTPLAVRQRLPVDEIPSLWMRAVQELTGGSLPIAPLSPAEALRTGPRQQKANIFPRLSPALERKAMDNLTGDRH